MIAACNILLYAHLVHEGDVIIQTNNVIEAAMITHSCLL